MYRRQKLTINGIAQWISFKSMQDLADKITEMVQTQSNVKTVYFGEYMENWFQIFKKPKLKENTVKGYRCLMENHIIPHIGNKPIDDITPEDVQKILNLQNSNSQGKRSGRSSAWSLKPLSSMKSIPTQIPPKISVSACLMARLNANL